MPATAAALMAVISVILTCLLQLDDTLVCAVSSTQWFVSLAGNQMANLLQDIHLIISYDQTIMIYLGCMEVVK